MRAPTIAEAGAGGVGRKRKVIGTYGCKQSSSRGRQRRGCNAVCAYDQWDKRRYVQLKQDQTQIKSRVERLNWGARAAGR